MIDKNNYYKGYTISDLIKKGADLDCPYQISTLLLFGNRTISSVLKAAEDNLLYKEFKDLPKLPEHTNVLVSFQGAEDIAFDIHYYMKTNTGKKVYLKIELDKIFYWYIDNKRYFMNRYHNTENTKAKTIHKVIDGTISVEEVMLPSSSFNTITNHGETRLFLHQWCEAKLRKIVLYRPTAEEYKSKYFFECFAVNTSDYYV